MDKMPNFSVWDKFSTPELFRGTNILIVALGDMDSEKKLRVVDNFTSLPNGITTLLITDSSSWKYLCNQLDIKMYMLDSKVIKSLVKDDLEYMILENGIVVHKEKIVSDAWTEFDMD